jgi:hypothetical protein
MYTPTPCWFVPPTLASGGRLVAFTLTVYPSKRFHAFDSFAPVTVSVM